MKAWVLEVPKPVEQSPLRIADLPVPAPGAGEVLVRVRACGICRTDLHLVEGELPVHRSDNSPGHQIVGEIAETGERVGIAWLHSTCGHCASCLSGRENLCDGAQFTGWDVPGGFAEYVLADRNFTYPLPSGMDDLHAAPLLCAGIIGYRCLKQCGLDSGWAGARLGIYGFGAAGHVALQVARARGAEVFVCTRDHERHQALAAELGAAWVGDADAQPPASLDAAILFAPAGELVPVALRALAKGGVLVLGGIHMSPIPSLPYDLLYGERVLRSVANNTRADGREFLEEAARIPVRTRVQVFPFEQANEALRALKHDAIAGAGVLQIHP